MKNSTTLLAGCMLFSACGASVCFSQATSYTTLEGNHVIEPKEVSPGVWEEGWLDISSDLLIRGGFGLGLTAANNTALSVFYTETGSVYRVSSRTNRTGSAYRWEEGSAGSPKMELGANNTLTLYNSSGTPTITLSPATGNMTATGVLDATGGVRLADNTMLTGVTSLRSGTLYNSAGQLVARAEPDYSFSTGLLTEARGVASFVGGGDDNFAIGSFAFVGGGSVNSASGRSSAVLGGGANGADGNYSAVIGGTEGLAVADASVVLGGQGNWSAGGMSIVLGGEYNAAYGHSSVVAGGMNNSAEALSSIILGGHNNVARGLYSFSSGIMSNSIAFLSFVVGSNNVLHGDSEQWIPTDDIFIIGNGYPDSTGGDRSNAFTVHKNGATRSAGTIDAKGGVRVPPGGDIPMGAFTAGRNPADMGVGLRYTGE